MYDRDNKEYRRSTYSKTTQKDVKVNGGFVMIILLQVFLCTIIVLVSVGVKYWGEDLYTDFEDTYSEIMEDSLTAGEINSWILQAENWFEQAMKIFEKTPLSENISIPPHTTNPPIEPNAMGKGGQMQVSDMSKSIEGVNMENVIVLGDFTFPLDSDLIITSFYGYREHPITGEPDFHTGLDFAAEKGTEIHAIKPGIVNEVGKSDTYGKYVSILHESGLETFYAHCDKILVRKGKKVDMGDVIAKVGNTGVSTGYHLHLETRTNGVKFDPNCLFKIENDIGE